MDLQALIAASDLPPAIVRQIEALVEAKRRTNERANGIRLPAIEALIRDELARASELPPAPVPADAAALADALFLDLVND